MECWKSVVALTVVGAFVVGPVWAQSTTDKSTTGATGTMDKDKGAAGTMDKDKGAAGTMDKDKGAAGTMDKRGTDKGAAGTMDKSTAGTTDKAPRGEMKGDKGDRAARGGNTGQVKAVQQALKDKGHDPGPIDGRMGPKTQAALKDFQKAQGLKETGRLDTETIAKLEIKTGAADTSMPAASPKTDSSTGAAKSSDAPKPTDSAKPAEPKADSAAPSASPATGPTPGATKPADTTKPAEEKK